jgi:hypothetical protein
MARLMSLMSASVRYSACSDRDGGLLLGDDLVLHVAQARGPLLLALEHVVDPTEVGLVAFPRAQEILARHLRHARGEVEDAAFVVLDLAHDVAQLAHQRVGERAAAA